MFDRHFRPPRRQAKIGRSNAGSTNLNRHSIIEGIGNAPAANRRSRSAFAAALFTVFVWALSFPLIKIALADLHPLPLAAARFGLASLILIAWLGWKRPALPSARDAGRFIICGGIGIALYNGLLNAGQQTVSASAASFIVNTVPILTALFATIFADERFDRWGWVGALTGFAGVGLIAGAQPGGLSFGSGAFLVFGSAVAQAIFFIIQRPLVQRHGALASTAYTMLAGTLMLIPWMPNGLTALAAPETSLATVGSVVALAFLPAIMGYAAWSYAMGHYGAARSSAFLYLVPPTATTLAFGLFGERPTTTTLVGGLIAIGGVALVNARKREAPKLA